MITGKIMVFFAVVLSAHTASAAFRCTVCHSKDPKMVAMHRALTEKSCFDCHKIGENLMGRSKPKDRTGLMTRRVSDVNCIPCHGR